MRKYTAQWFERESIIGALKTFKQSLAKRIRVSRMIFFGSRATGIPHSDSDIDLLIVSDDFAGKKFRPRARGFDDVWSLNCPVDFLCYTPDEVEDLKDEPTVVREALATGIEIA